MAERFLALLVLSVVCVHCAVLKGKAFYCRDPDTGKLHAVNTTWTASSFCGNYTCNIRRRNLTLPSANPIREFNVSNISEHKSNITEGVTVTIEKKIEPNLQTLLHKTITSNPRNIINSEDTKLLNTVNDVITPSTYNHLNQQDNYRPEEHNCKKQKVSKLPDENDRYLTEKEIDSIADLLHTVKKSDLDAIVDIYNLAQDIYKEMGEKTTEKVKDKEIYTNEGVKSPSYWYDPLANKGRIGDRHEIDLQNKINLISTDPPKLQPLSYYNKGSLINDVAKTPMYYPVTQFQRISSYTNPALSYKATTQNANAVRKFESPKEDIQNQNIVEDNKADSRKLIQPSHYLPYPFTNIRPHNITESRNAYYSSPWMLDYFNRYKYYQPYYSAYVGPVQKAVLINPHLNNEVQDVEQHIIEQAEIKNDNVFNDKDSVDILLKGQMTPNWKTEPVPVDVLKEIRADIDTSRLLKSFPLRKKIKLERVGKVINMDDLNTQVNRNKRFANFFDVQKENATEYEEYETFLEKVTCQDQIELGYFRIGNLTQPYPKCCPQLIDTR